MRRSSSQRARRRAGVTGGSRHLTVKQVAAAVDALGRVSFTELTDDQLAGTLVELHRVASALEASITRAVGVTDARRAVDDDGARSIGRWVAWRCRIPVGRAVREAANGHALRQMPEVEAAFTAGALTGEHVRVLAEAAARNPRAFERDVGMLLDHASKLTYRNFTRSVSYSSHLHAPDEMEERAAALDADRRCTARRPSAAPGCSTSGCASACSAARPAEPSRCATARACIRRATCRRSGARSTTISPTSSAGSPSRPTGAAAAASTIASDTATPAGDHRRVDHERAAAAHAAEPRVRRAVTARATCARGSCRSPCSRPARPR